MLIDIDNEPKRAAMIQALARESTITAYAAVRPQLLAPLRVAFADAGAGKTSVVFKSIRRSASLPPSACGRGYSGSPRVHDDLIGWQHLDRLMGAFDRTHTS